MRLVVPLVFEQGEYLASQPGLLKQLVQRATAAGRATLDTLRMKGHVVLAHDAQRAPLAATLRKLADTVLPLDAPGTELGDAALLPPGAISALAADPCQTEISLLLNPRSPSPESKVLTKAYESLQRSNADLLFSACPAEDNLCQGKILYQLLQAPNMPIGQGLTMKTTATGTTLTLDTPCPAGSLLLVWQQSRKLALAPRPNSGGNTLRFDVPQGFVLQESARWGLLHQTPVPGPGFQMLPFAPPGVPWYRDCATNRVHNVHTGRWIAGRQDFPETLTPDRHFCLVRPGVHSGLTTMEALKTTAFRHDPTFPALIKDEFSALAWSLLQGQTTRPLA